MNLIILFTVLVGCTSCSQILVLYPFGTLSHKISFYPAIEALGAKGHNVTVVTIYPPKQHFKNVREIVLPVDLDSAGMDWFQMRKVPKAIAQITGNFFISGIGEQLFELMMSNDEFSQILRDRQVDLVLIDAIFTEFCLPIANHLNVPYILVSSSTTGLPWHYKAFGIPSDLAVIPSPMSPYSGEMSFLERVGNVMLHNTMILARELIVISKYETFTKKHFNYTTLLDLEKKASLLFISSNPSYAWPKPLPANVVELGTLHCRPSKPLPQELQNIADDSAEHGFIVFTLGSLIKVSSMPQKALEVFLKVFARLPQKVIWKWEADLPEASPNVHIVKWLPQQDLLGHPNARLFISHGGLLGIQEAIYHAVPLLGLPVVNDQDNNIRKIVEEGMSVKLEWDDLTEDMLYEVMSTMINNSSYAANAKRLSSIMKDNLVPGTEKAVYWIEYVIRHGATHLRPMGDNLFWYQHYLLDVLAFLALCGTLVFLLNYWLWRKLILACIRSRSNKTPLKRE